MFQVFKELSVAAVLTYSYKQTQGKLPFPLQRSCSKRVSFNGHIPHKKLTMNSKSSSDATSAVTWVVIQVEKANFERHEPVSEKEALISR